MKTLQETKDVLAKSYGYHDWKDFIDLLRKSAPADKLFIMDGMVDKVAIRYTEEVLKVAAERAEESLIECYQSEREEIRNSVLNLIEELK